MQQQQPPKTATSSTKKASEPTSDELSETEKNSISLFSKLVYKIEQNGDNIIANRELQELHGEICTLHTKLFANLEDVDQKITRLSEMTEKINKILELYNKIIEERMAYVSRRSECRQSSLSPLPFGPSLILFLLEPPIDAAVPPQYAPPTSHATQWSSPPSQQGPPLTPSSFQSPLPPSQGYQPAYAPQSLSNGYSNPNAAHGGQSYYAPSTTPATSSSGNIYNPNAESRSMGGGTGNPAAYAPITGYGAPFNSGGYQQQPPPQQQPQQPQYPPGQNQYPAMPNQFASPSPLLIDL